LRQGLKNRIVSELYFLILLFPVWWILGMEQFIWVISVGLIFIQFLIFSKFQFKINIVALLLLFFLVVYGVSFVSITEKMRYITYFRNLSTYLTAFMLVVVVWNIVDEWWQVEKLLGAIIFVMLIASIVGILAFMFDSFRIRFKSLVGFFMPSSISSTGYGSVIAVRNVGFYNWFIGLGEYFRVSSFFLYSTMFSSTLAIVLPIALFLKKINIGIKKFYFSIVVVIMGLSLLATTGRVAILAIFVAYFIFKFLSIKSFSIRFSIIAFSFFFILLSLLWLAQTGLLYQIIDFALYSRGEGSANARSKIYIQTFESFLERPIFGWGTERDVKGLAYPLGSHSYYLGTLYKQGVAGLILFLSIIANVWINIKVKSNLNYKVSLFFRYGQFMLLVFIINSFTDVLDLDATTMMFLWVIIALLTVSKRLSANPKNQLND
tara:strand:+ start:112 stop:1413 length:1302 start_codon:yes stop_codon:yes gene_type:complete